MVIWFCFYYSLSSEQNSVLIIQGVNLSSVVQSGQVIYLDGLKLISEALYDGHQEESPVHCRADNDADDSNPFTNIRYNLTIKCLTFLSWQRQDFQT